MKIMLRYKKADIRNKYSPAPSKRSYNIWEDRYWEMLRQRHRRQM